MQRLEQKGQPASRSVTSSHMDLPLVKWEKKSHDQSHGRTRDTDGSEHRPTENKIKQREKLGPVL